MNAQASPYSLAQRVRTTLGRARQKTVERYRNWLRVRVKHLHGPRKFDTCADTVVVVCLVRNGEAYLDGFLDHYRRLGVTHFAFLDNGSTDGTVEKLRQHHGVTVLRSTAPFQTYKEVMREYLTHRFGSNNWVLCVDVDELFDYPFSNAVSLRALLEYLNQNHFTAVAAQMLDMFPKGPPLKGHGENWLHDHRFYNIKHLEYRDYAAYYGARNALSNRNLRIHLGGIRSAAFDAKNWLTKHPMIFPSKGVRLKLNHHAVDAHIADFSAVLLHYKFVGDFVRYFREAVQAESFWNGSVHYKRYLEAFERNPEFELHDQDSEEFHSPDQLVDSGFLIVSDRFENYAREIQQYPKSDIGRSPSQPVDFQSGVARIDKTAG